MLTNFKSNIKRLVNELGRTATLRSYTLSGSSFNPTRSQTDTTISLVAFDYSADEIDGTLVQSGDKDFVIESSVEVSKDDRIVDNGVEYTIIQLETVNPGSETLMYIAQGRS